MRAKDILRPDEVLIHSSRRHWIGYFASMALAVWGLTNVFGASGFAGYCFFWAGVFAAYQFILNKTAVFMVTDKRVMLRLGVLKRRCVELRADRVEGLFIEQSALGRALGYGTIIVSGTGGMRQPFKCIRQPQAFHEALFASPAPG